MRNRTLSLVRLRPAVRSASYAVAALALGSSTCLAAGDAAAGHQVFASRCSVCHATEPGVNKIGPSLAGVFGRKSGTEAGFDYSPALKAAAIMWDEKTLDQSFKILAPTFTVPRCWSACPAATIVRTSSPISRQ